MLVFQLTQKAWQFIHTNVGDAEVVALLPRTAFRTVEQSDVKVLVSLADMAACDIAEKFDFSFGITGIGVPDRISVLKEEFCDAVTRVLAHAGLVVQYKRDGRGGDTGDVGYFSKRHICSSL